MRYVVTSVGCTITISSKDTNNTTLSLGECALATVKYSDQANPVYLSQMGASTMTFATNVEAVGVDNNVILRIVRATGGGVAGNRNHYSYDNTYCWSGVGTARGYGQGHIDNTSVGGAAVANITFTCSAGTISGTYSAVHSY